MDETIIDERSLRALLAAGIETIKVEEHIIEVRPVEFLCLISDILLLYILL